MKLALHLPINTTSFGRVSVGILKEIFSLKLEPSLFLIGNLDFEDGVSDEFKNWVNSCLVKGLRTHSRKDPVFKLWHINGSLESFSDRQFLFTFHELDSLTHTEVNILKNSEKVLVSSNYSVKTFREHGVDNTSYLPLFFDSSAFSPTNKTYFTDGRITFNIFGKFEKRKHHAKAIRTWINKFGNNREYSLQCAIYNNFLSQEDNKKIVNQIVENKKFFNVNFFGYMKQNALYNEFLNSGDVGICMSGGEGWGLPEFQSTAIGKHAVVLNCHGYQSWANSENSVLVNPTSKTPVYDGMFFHQGSEYNQGNIYDWNESNFIEGCERAIQKVKENKINKEGLKLQQDFSAKKTVEQILSLF